MAISYYISDRHFASVSRAADTEDWKEDIYFPSSKMLIKGRVVVMRAIATDAGNLLQFIDRSARPRKDVTRQVKVRETRTPASYFTSVSRAADTEGL